MLNSSRVPSYACAGATVLRGPVEFGSRGSVAQTLRRHLYPCPNTLELLALRVRRNGANASPITLSEPRNVPV
eukprot:8134757-Pyramimonas_sp.AAC.2